VANEVVLVLDPTESGYYVVAAFTTQELADEYISNSRYKWRFTTETFELDIDTGGSSE